MIGGKRTSYYLFITVLIAVVIAERIIRQLERRLLDIVDARIDEENTRQLNLMREIFNKDVLDARLEIIRNDRSAVGGNIPEERHHPDTVYPGMAGESDSGQGYGNVEPT